MRTYKVKEGDTLSGIALSVYGDAGKWYQLFHRNRRVIIEEILRRNFKQGEAEPENWIFPNTILEL